jgi:hypothetical protein
LAAHAGQQVAHVFKIGAAAIIELTDQIEIILDDQARCFLHAMDRGSGVGICLQMGNTKLLTFYFTDINGFHHFMPWNYYKVNNLQIGFIFNIVGMLMPFGASKAVA